MTVDRKSQRAAHPLNWAKRITVDFLTRWFTENALFPISTAAASDPEPLPSDPSTGRTVARTGTPQLAIMGSFSRTLQADVTRRIVVQRGRFRSDRSTIGNQAGNVMIEWKGARQMAKRFTAHDAIPIVAWCLSAEGEEAEEIAGYVHAGFQFWRVGVRRDYPGLRDIIELSVGEQQQIQRVSTTHEVIGVPVSLVLDIQYEWLIFQTDAEPLQQIRLQIEGDLECVVFGDGGEVPWPSS